MSKTDPTRRPVRFRDLLSRLWHQRDAHRWTIHCHDEHHRRARLRVGFSDDGVTLDISCSGPVVLAPMQAGRLRSVIRDAIDAIERPEVAAQRVAQVPATRPLPKPWPPAARARERVVLDNDSEPPTHPRFHPPDPAALHADHARRHDEAPTTSATGETRGEPDDVKDGHGREIGFPLAAAAA